MALRALQLLVLLSAASFASALYTAKDAVVMITDEARLIVNFTNAFTANFIYNDEAAIMIFLHSRSSVKRIMFLSQLDMHYFFLEISITSRVILFFFRVLLQPVHCRRRSRRATSR